MRTLPALLLLACLLGACAHRPKQMYDGPARPLAQVAEVWSAAPPYRAPNAPIDGAGSAIDGHIHILAVDGIPADDWWENFAYVVHVLPGPHRFKVRFSVRRDYASGIVIRGNGELEGTLAAGEGYVIEARPDFDAMRVDFVMRRLRPDERPPTTDVSL